MPDTILNTGEATIRHDPAFEELIVIRRAQSTTHPQTYMPPQLIWQLLENIMHKIQ